MMFFQIIESIKRNLTNDLRKPKYRKSKNYLTGHCYVATEALYHLIQQEPVEYGFVPYCMRVGNDTHWFLMNWRGKVIDITAEQFSKPPDYSKATRKAFLTKQPSKRARILMSRVKHG